MQRDEHREELYLRDIIEAIESVARFLSGQTRDEFLASDLLQSAVLQKLSVIGEAAARMGRTMREENSHVPWSSIIGLRNIAVHAYFQVDWPLVWDTTQVHLPPLREQVQAILTTKFGAAGDGK